MVADGDRESESRSSSPALGFPRQRFFRYRRLRWGARRIESSGVWNLLAVHYIFLYFIAIPMPNSKTQRRGHEAGKDHNRRGRLTEKASSFHGRSPVVIEVPKQLRRPRTVPDLRSTGVPVQAASAGAGFEERPRLSKLLLNVTMQGSLGPVHVIMTPDSKVGDLIATAMRQYVKEGRRPMLLTADPSCYDLHYSQFSLESKIFSPSRN